MPTPIFDQSQRVSVPSLIEAATIVTAGCDTQRRRAYALKATLLNAHHADSAAQSGNRRSRSEMTDTGNGHFT